MLSKKNITKYRRQTRCITGEKLFRLRCQVRKTLSEVGAVCGLPAKLLERYELGKGYLDLSHLSIIAAYYNKTVTIHFDNLSSEDEEK